MLVSFCYAARPFARLMETGGARRLARATPLLGQRSWVVRAGACGREQGGRAQGSRRFSTRWCSRHL